jgi:ATP-binding cassette subfamily C protein CydD
LLYGRLLFEQAFFILLMAPEFYLPMRNLGMRYHAGMTGVTAASRIFEVLDLPEPETVWKTPEEQKKLRMDEPIFIRFKRVGFIYPHNSQNSIKSVDLLIESGRHYALVGRSGAGKSTLLQLLMGFLVPTAGRITVNDIDLRMVDHREWRKRIAWVPQSPMIFNVSLLENVRLENEDISEGRVWEALRMAQLADFARELPQGLETPLGEWGVRLSGGQVQRVALARAFVKDAPFIFMDEPTAHLDPILEQSLRVSTGELLKGRTSVVIAHRLATVRDADSILVIEGGRIVESGIHEELMAMKGYYSGLFLSQEGGS